MSDIGICDHCGEYGDATAHNEECPLVMRAEIAALRASLRDAEGHVRYLAERLRKEEECHAQTCRLFDEWIAKLTEAKRLGLMACEVASAEWTPLACDAAGITAIAAALEKL